MNVFYKISIDRVNANYISGWCFHRLYPHRTVRLECVQNDTLQAKTEASLFREDLKALGVHPSGKCGFELIPEKSAGFDLNQPLSIRVEGKGSVLADVAQGAGSLTPKGMLGRLKRLSARRKKLTSTAVFMHIPKTAGTSFNTLAQSIYPKGTTINHIELLPESSYRSCADTYNYVSGHLRFGQLKEYFDTEQIAFYTILREPYAQLQSHLRWLIQTAANSDDNYFKTTNPVIYDLGRKLGQQRLSDSQALSDFVHRLTATEAAFVDNLQTRYFLDQQPARVTVADLDTAVANSRRFALIGLTEDYERFVNDYIEMNGLSGATVGEKMNISTTEPLFDLGDESVRQILLPLVRVDLELYWSLGGLEK